jgi:hypothetical protein
VKKETPSYIVYKIKSIYLTFYSLIVHYNHFVLVLEPLVFSKEGIGSPFVAFMAQTSIFSHSS